MEDSLDYYGVLNLNQDCTTDDVKRAYKKFSQAFHPDRHVNDQMNNEANEAFSRVSKSYTVLIDPEKRKLYDQDLLNSKTRNNRALVRYAISDYSNVDLIKERKKLLDDVAFYSAIITRGNSSVTLDMKELIDPKFQSATFLEKLTQTNIYGMAVHQSSEFELSQSNLVKFDSQIMLKGGYGKGLFGVGVNHLLSPSSRIGLTYYMGEGSKLVFNGMQIVNNATKCNLLMTTELNRNNLLLGYQLKVVHPLTPSLKTTVICESFTPPELTFKLSYMSQTSFYTEMFTKVGGRLFTYGTSLLYGVSNALSVGLSGSINNESISGGYSAEYKVDRLNRVYGTVDVSPEEGVVLTLNYQRQNQTITFPIMLADHMSLKAAVIGTLGGVFCAGFFDLVIVNALKYWDKEKYKKAIAQQKNENLNKMKMEAKSAIMLMKPKYDTIVADEVKKNGLIILKAFMGEMKLLSSDEYNPNSNDIIDLKIPLQFLVKDSKLVVKSGSKYSIPGFYKLDTNKPIFIKILYSFRGGVHQFSANMEDAIVLPKKCHVLESHGIVI